MIYAKVEVFNKHAHSPVLRQFSTHIDLSETYQAVSRSVAWFSSQGFRAEIWVSGDIRSLSALKLAIPCLSCGKPEREHVDQWGRHEPCFEQIIETVVYHEARNA